ncbi:hypothetical protein RESH_04138 [Rhodopirellula europaea SH398]|uniref:Uncharacterized protein n=1 Tax=Rhodopirellula europaea SH398 TaxID=1263868 RepID=M5SC76_9BACT|nr:hypothetical protein RESH_04138 [Rhodopirellula europaea SH398]
MPPYKGKIGRRFTYRPTRIRSCPFKSRSQHSNHVTAQSVIKVR